MTFEITRNGYTVSDDPARLDFDVIHDFLKDAYWSEGVPRRIVEKSARHSLTFGLYDPRGAQVGYGRSVTDRSTFAYLADVFVLEHERGKGLGRFLVDAIMEHPDHQGLKHMILATDDAHGLYQSAGFESLADSTAYMHKLDLDIYKRT